MAPLKKILSLLLLVASSLLWGQQKNELLDRDFWKTNPSIETVKAKIAEGHDPSELNSNAFDPTGYAILEKVSNETIKFLLEQKGNGVNKRTHDGRTYIFWAAYRDNLELMKHLVAQGADPKIVDSHGYSLLNFAATTGQQRTELYDYIISQGADVKLEKNRNGANALLLVAPFMKDAALLDYFVSKGLPLNSTDAAGNGLFNHAAKGGNTQILQLLVDKGVDFNIRSKDGENAVLMASRGRRGHENTLDTYLFLEKLGIPTNTMDTEGQTPLHHIAYSGKDKKVYDYFLEKGVDIDQEDASGNTPFLNAAYRNDLEIVRHLAPRVKNIDHANKEGKAALTRALEQNTPEVIAFLITEGADIHIKDLEGNRLSYYLTNSFNASKTAEFEKKMTLLQEAGLDMALPQENGNTLYHLAAEKNDLAFLKKIGKMKIPINAKNKEGNTALHIAAMKSDNDAILKRLLQEGADKTVKTDFEESALDLAYENELLKKNNVELNFLR